MIAFIVRKSSLFLQTWDELFKKISFLTLRNEILFHLLSLITLYDIGCMLIHAEHTLSALLAEEHFIKTKMLSF